jgi:hypothetical protein
VSDSTVQVALEGDGCRQDVAGRCGVAVLETIARLPNAAPSGASTVVLFARVDPPDGEDDPVYVSIEIGMQAFIDAARAMAQIESIAFEQKVMEAVTPRRLTN